MKPTKTSIRRAQMMKERSQSPVDEGKAWKLKKYRNIKGRVKHSSVSPSMGSEEFKLPMIEGVKYM